MVVSSRSLSLWQQEEKFCSSSVGADAGQAIKGGEAIVSYSPMEHQSRTEHSQAGLSAGRDVVNHQ